MKIERRDVRTQLIGAILVLIIFSFLIPVAFGLRSIDPMIIVMPFIFISIAIISLVFYIINPEIMYGIWLSRKKYKELKESEPNNRNIKIGRNILLGHCVIGMVFITLIYFQSISTILN